MHRDLPAAHFCFLEIRNYFWHNRRNARRLHLHLRLLTLLQNQRRVSARLQREIPAVKQRSLMFIFVIKCQIKRKEKSRTFCGELAGSGEIVGCNYICTNILHSATHVLSF